MSMAYDLKNEKEAKKYLDDVEMEYKFNCYHDKDGAGCYRLAEFLVNVRKRYHKSCELFKSACDDYKHGQACFRYGNNKILGKGCTKDLKEAMAYHERGCQYGWPSSCHNVGLFHMNGQGNGQVNIKSGLEYFKLACDQNDPHSCHSVSAIYIKGKGDVDQNMTEAFKYSLKSCELENMYACANVSQMYKKGDGVEQNQELATKYKRLAQHMFNVTKKMKESDSVTFDR